MLDLAAVGAESVVYDLGCGDGRFVLRAASRGVKRAEGYELAWYPFLVAWVCALRYHNAHIHRSDFWDCDFSDGTVIILYLLPEQLGHMQAKLCRELKPGTIVLTYQYTVRLPFAMRSCVVPARWWWW